MDDYIVDSVCVLLRSSTEISNFVLLLIAKKILPLFFRNNWCALLSMITSGGSRNFKNGGRGPGAGEFLGDRFDAP